MGVAIDDFNGGKIKIAQLGHKCAVYEHRARGYEFLVCREKKRIRRLCMAARPSLGLNAIRVLAPGEKKKQTEEEAESNTGNVAREPSHVRGERFSG